MFLLGLLFQNLKAEKKGPIKVPFDKFRGVILKNIYARVFIKVRRDK
ncbi:hypothetical protein GMMP1_50024 [Candidatus Magnetomoraceae bacterium gMMP-1]